VGEFPRFLALHRLHFEMPLLIRLGQEPRQFRTLLSSTAAAMLARRFAANHLTSAVFGSPAATGPGTAGGKKIMAHLLPRFGKAPVVAAAALLVAATMPVSAQAVTPGPFILPAGEACPDFGLRVDFSGDRKEAKVRTDRNGNVRTISAGKGYDLLFTNLETDETVSLKGNGSVLKATVYPDGTSTVASTGHNVLILFPTDIPAGPSTVLYVGRITYTVDGSGVFRVQSTSGRSTDICALLSA
jgi:hypothetical protein